MLWLCVSKNVDLIQNSPELLLEKGFSRIRKLLFLEKGKYTKTNLSNFAQIKNNTHSILLSISLHLTSVYVLTRHAGRKKFDLLMIITNYCPLITSELLQSNVYSNCMCKSNTNIALVQIIRGHKIY